MRIALTIVLLIANIYLLLLWGRFFLDLFRSVVRDWHPSDPVAVLLGFVMTVTDPPVRFFRRVVPPLRLGPMALDFGVFLAIAAMSLVVTILSAIG